MCEVGGVQCELFTETSAVTTVRAIATNKKTKAHAHVCIKEMAPHETRANYEH